MCFVSSLCTFATCVYDNTRLPVWKKDFRLLQSTQTDSVAHPASHSMGTMSYFSGHSFQSMRQTTHLHLIQSLRMSAAVPLLLARRLSCSIQGKCYFFFRHVCKIIKKLPSLSSKLLPHRKTTCIPITTNYKKEQFK